MLGFLLWLILLVFCRPLALLALVLYPLVWLLLLPVRIVALRWTEPSARLGSRHAAGSRPARPTTRVNLMRTPLFQWGGPFPESSLGRAEIRLSDCPPKETTSCRRLVSLLQGGE